MDEIDVEHILATFERLGVSPIVYILEWHVRSCSPYAATYWPKSWTYIPEDLAQQYEAVMIERNIRNWLQGVNP